tara:strand:+ start:392 stop:1057 length:666 start_codon:yes stop_codon:yes gene_type:complete
MSFLIAGAVVAGAGVAKAISGGVQKKKAKAEAAKAQAELEAQKAAFKGLDTSNPFLNLENTMEDLTVNQEEAQFVAEKQAQSQANILSELRGAAGGSGIAALAQTLANQGSENARKAAISIGKQEQANQMAERNQAASIQKAERQGEIMSRNMKQQQVQALMGMAAQDVASARQAQAAADEKMWSGITSAAGGIAGGVGGSGILGDKFTMSPQMAQQMLQM